MSGVEQNDTLLYINIENHWIAYKVFDFHRVFHLFLSFMKFNCVSIPFHLYFHHESSYGIGKVYRTNSYKSFLISLLTLSCLFVIILNQS